MLASIETKFVPARLKLKENFFPRKFRTFQSAESINMHFVACWLLISNQLLSQVINHINTINKSTKYCMADIMESTLKGCKRIDGGAGLILVTGHFFTTALCLLYFSSTSPKSS